MIIGTISRIIKEDLAKSGDLPKWIDSLVDPLNGFITTIGQAIKGQLNFADNFLCKVYTIELTHGKALSINPQSRLKVTGMLPLDGNGQRIDSWGFTRNQDGTLSVTVKFDGGTSTTKSNVSFVIFF